MGLTRIVSRSPHTTDRGLDRFLWKMCRRRCALKKSDADVKSMGVEFNGQQPCSHVDA